MNARIAAWVGVVVVSLGIWHYAPRINNPFSGLPTISPVAGALPAMPAGCKEKDC